MDGHHPCIAAKSARSAHFPQLTLEDWTARDAEAGQTPMGEYCPVVHNWSKDQTCSQFIVVAKNL
jgi:hypothetical protein